MSPSGWSSSTRPRLARGPSVVPRWWIWVGDSRDDHKHQYAHQHESHGDGDDHPHRHVVALVGAEGPPHLAVHPVRGATHVHTSNGGVLRSSSSGLHRSQRVTAADYLLLLLLRRRQRQAVLFTSRALWLLMGRLAFQLQLALAAFEAHRHGPLHLRRELLEHGLVVAELRQVAAVRELGDFATHGARKLLQLGGRDVDASEALQAERVATGQQLGHFKHIVVRAEAHGTLRLAQEVVCGGHLCVAVAVWIMVVAAPSPVLPTTLIRICTCPPLSPVVPALCWPAPAPAPAFRVAASAPWCRRWWRYSVFVRFSLWLAVVLRVAGAFPSSFVVVLWWTWFNSSTAAIFSAVIGTFAHFEVLTSWLKAAA